MKIKWPHPWRRLRAWATRDPYRIDADKPRDPARPIDLTLYDQPIPLRPDPPEPNSGD